MYRRFVGLLNLLNCKSRKKVAKEENKLDTPKTAAAFPEKDYSEEPVERKKKFDAKSEKDTSIAEKQLQESDKVLHEEASKENEEELSTPEVLNALEGPTEKTFGKFNNLNHYMAIGWENLYMTSYDCSEDGIAKRNILYYSPEF